ncbi:hypothetical protein RND71_028320 [Anisodus tanguticus]|uniref:Uncharacterized protein n=1 Tax=Anisodus tanguticus TaxID=243964 RepID=A0AAE1RLA0_9SOLA|nr:hypothetical protein RND71_028320 [Anisodus tanguticus]
MAQKCDNRPKYCDKRRDVARNQFHITALYISLTIKKPSDDIFNRTTASGGSWIQQDKGKHILDEDENLVIGNKRRLNYKHKKDSSLNGR